MYNMHDFISKIISIRATLVYVTGTTMDGRSLGTRHTASFLSRVKRGAILAQISTVGCTNVTDMRNTMAA